MDLDDLLVEAEQGNTQAQFEVGYMLIRGIILRQDAGEGRVWLRRAAVAGHAGAQAHLASHDLFGRDSFADPSEIIKWLSLSARQNEPLACHCLGYCYHSGIGVAENHEQAVACILNAARLGLSQAQFMLAQFYRDGFGVAQNLEQAEAWFKVAAEQGHEEAKKALKELIE
jgi:TPR repeat protein